MGDNYEWGLNPIKDFLFQLLILEKDISSKKLKDELKGNINYLMLGMGIDENDLYFLDYEIKKHLGIHFKVLPNNIVTAMWFSGFFPDEPNLIIEKNIVTFGDYIFKFNRKTKKLTWKRRK